MQWHWNLVQVAILITAHEHDVVTLFKLQSTIRAQSLAANSDTKSLYPVILVTKSDSPIGISESQTLLSVFTRVTNGHSVCNQITIGSVETCNFLQHSSHAHRVIKKPPCGRAKNTIMWAEPPTCRHSEPKANESQYSPSPVSHKKPVKARSRQPKEIKPHPSADKFLPSC